MYPGLGVWFAATRPAFLSATFVGVLLGIASTIHDQTFRSIPLAMVALFFALIAHAGANVINDYYDALSGCDDTNTERISPFTGGSRFIQDGLLTQRQTKLFGYGLLASVIPAGLFLLTRSGSDLLWIGLAGLISGWAYSAPPLKLQSRGLGEIAIMIAWVMVTLGSAFVQSHNLSTTTMVAALAYAPLVANVLFVNQIPDRNADAYAGKKTLIVRHGASIAFRGSLLLYLASVSILTIGVVQGYLPSPCLLAGIAVIPAIRSLYAMYQSPTDPTMLRAAIPTAIQSCIVFGSALTLGLLL
jgi:1,4-dihydroxy-2-naphthoate octaprenyltransferase